MLVPPAYVKRSASLAGADRFFFPQKLKYLPIDEEVIVLSPETANWLVVNAKDVDLVERLVAGETIGAVAVWARSNERFAAFQVLLAQIISRKFAATDAAPLPLKDQSVKGAYFYLTNACNLRCSHCYMYSGKAEQGELSVGEWKALVGEFAQNGGTNITFSGGEILAKKGWLGILEYAHQKNISITLLTNGTLWDLEIIKRIAPWLAEVQISVDGPNELINGMTRGGGYFSKALETAKAFNAHGVRTSIAMTPTAETIYLFESGFKDFFSAHIEGSGINVRIGHKLLNGREVKMLDEKAKAQFAGITSRLAEAIYPESDARIFLLGHQPNEISHNCGFGGLTISSTGDVYSCNRIADVASLGNVRKSRLADLMLELDAAELYSNVDKIWPCRECDLRYICGGGCRIDDFNLYDESGNQTVFKKRKLDETTKLKKIKCTENHRSSLLRSIVDAHHYAFAGGN